MRSRLANTIVFYKSPILHLDTDLNDHGGSGVLMYTVKCVYIVSKT